jgi:hypothetical protein
MHLLVKLLCVAVVAVGVLLKAARTVCELPLSLEPGFTSLLSYSGPAHCTHTLPLNLFSIDFRGELKDGEMHGVSCVLVDGGDRYEGGYHRGQRSGWGTLFLSNGHQISAKWADGRPGGDNAVLRMPPTSLTSLPLLKRILAGVWGISDLVLGSRIQGSITKAEFQGQTTIHIPSKSIMVKGKRFFF